MNTDESRIFDVFVRSDYLLLDVPVEDESPLELTFGRCLFVDGFVVLPSQEGKIIRVIKKPLEGGYNTEITVASSDEVYLNVDALGENYNYKVFFRKEPSLQPTYASIAEVPYGDYISMRNQ